MDITKYEPGTPCWVELETTDTAAAKSFYGELLGWRYDDLPIPDGGVYSMAKLRGKDVAGLSGMSPGSKAASAPPHWNTYVMVTDVKATTARVGGLGGTVLAEPFDVMDSGKMSVLQDPTGATLALWQEGKHGGAAAANEPGAWCWSELYTRDADKAKKFYSQLLGWTTKPMEGGGPEMFEVKGRAMADVMTIRKEWGPMPTHWAVFFQVADVDDVVKRTERMGGKVTMPASTMGTMRMAGLTDPQGGAFMIVKPQAG